MERASAVAIPINQTIEKQIVLTGSQVQPPLVVANLVIHSAEQRALRIAKVRCAGFMVVALMAVAAYIIVPLALALHAAVQPVPVVLVISAAILAELVLVVTFIILKTEGTRDAATEGF
ncbi:hypothetical protein [Arthrobacter sp. K5]|jgi:hypothetical protein|uniref:Integral membrane protein n=1 Tax=Arthrobacter sp. K5 TaxID=2839623 RepID=A0AAU8ETY2_9MICC